MFQGLLSGGLGNQLSEMTGVEDPHQAASAANTIFSTLLGAIQQNASTPEGAQALNNALERDHDGSILDNLAGFLGGQAQPQNSNMLNGAGILGHIFGNKQENVVNAVSQNTGMDSGAVIKMMMMLAPVVLGMLGKAKNQTGADAGGLSSIIGSVLGGQAGNNPILNVLGSVLGGSNNNSSNGGGLLGNILGGSVGNILGGLFGGKK